MGNKKNHFVLKIVILVMLQQLGFIFEFTTTVIGLFLGYFVLKKDKKYIGNQLMASALAAIGLYTLFIFIYDFISIPIVIQVFLRIAIITIISATMLLYFAMQVLVHSSSWIEDKRKWMPWVILVIVVSVVVIAVDFITIADLEVVNTTLDIGILLLIVATILFFVILSIVDLYLHGIKEVTDAGRKKKLIVFLIGLLVNLGAVGINIASNLVPEDLGAILDVFFFGTLALATIVMAFSFLMKTDSA